MANIAFQSFDGMIAGQAGIDAERQSVQQRYTNPTTPNPSQLIADHSNEGAWPQAARDIPENPPAPPVFVANHADHVLGYMPATYDQVTSCGSHGNPNALGPHGIDNHIGTDDSYRPSNWGDNYAQPQTYPLLNIGQPFEAREFRKRHLRTDQWDVTGKIVNPADAPSAPTQIWNSQHDTQPRWIGFDVMPLFQNVGKPGQFSTNPGYLGVNDGQPNRAPRQYGSVAAQMPDDPYVSQGASSGVNAVSYEWDFG